MIEPVFQQKERESLQLINETLSKYKEHTPYMLHSTGKDSVVVEYLCKLSSHNVKTVFNNTTLDCSDTYKIVNQHKNEWEITTPDEGFYQYVKRANFIPTRFGRGCCTIFKEGNHIDHFKNVEKAIWIMGVRNDESAKRANRQDAERNPKWGNKDWIGLLPIRKWTELEIWCYIIYNKLCVNPKYKKGYKRVGCSIACPFYTKTTWYLDKYWYKKQYDRWHKILEEDFIRNGKWCVLNCTLEEYHRYWNGGIVREQPTEEVITEFMKYKNITDRVVAEKYFNKQCTNCGKDIRSKDTIAMNLKLRGRNITKFMCKRCLMKSLNMDKDKWNEQIESFKEQGCSLF